MHVNAYMHAVVCANVGTWKQLKNNKEEISLLGTTEAG